MIKHLPARRGGERYLIGTDRARSEEQHTLLHYRLGLNYNNQAGPKTPGKYKRSERSIEWHIGHKPTKEFPFGFGLGFDITRGDGGDHDLNISLHFGPLGDIYTHFYGPWTKIFRVRESKPDYYEGRRYMISLFHYTKSWWRIEWAHPTQSWGQDSPGIDWNSGQLHRKVFGYEHSEWETTFEPMDVNIIMPEGEYGATIKRERIHKWYESWIGRMWTKIKPLPTWESWDVDIPGGIPVEGKGENSWDCGMDGMFGLHFPAKDAIFGDAILYVRDSVLRDREKYGGPFDLPRAMSVKEAEEWQKSKQ